MEVFGQKSRRTSGVRRTPSSEISDLVAQGKKFIPVEQDFDKRYVPDGYSKLNVTYKGERFIALVPQHVVAIIANEGEGDDNNALDELADFYDEIRQFEDGLILTGATNTAAIDLFTTTVDNYNTHLENALAVPKKEGDGSVDLDTPVFNRDLLAGLDVDDAFVEQRLKAMAAVMLGRDASELEAAELSDVLEHKTVRAAYSEKMTIDELKEATCYAGSHYALKPEFAKGQRGYTRGEKDGVQYEINRTANQDHLTGEKFVDEVKRPVLDTTVQKLQAEIEQHRRKKHGNVGRHDTQLLTKYANLAYIARERPMAQVDIQPAKGTEND